MSPRARAVVAATLLLGACSGGSDAPETAESPLGSAAVTIADTTAATTSSPAPATTAAAIAPPTTAATPASTTAAATAAVTAPATIPSDPAVAQQQVIDTVIAAWQAYRAAIRDPLDEDRLAAMATLISGPKLQRSVQEIANVASSGIVARENPTTPAALDIDEQTVVVDLAAGTASVEYCRIGSDLGVKIGGNPDGTDQIVVDEVNAYHERSDLVFRDGRWFDDDGVVIATFPGATTCAA